MVLPVLKQGLITTAVQNVCSFLKKNTHIYIIIAADVHSSESSSHSSCMTILKVVFFSSHDRLQCFVKLLLF